MRCIHKPLAVLAVFMFLAGAACAQSPVDNQMPAAEPADASTDSALAPAGAEPAPQAPPAPAPAEPAVPVPAMPPPQEPPIVAPRPQAPPKAPAPRTDASLVKINFSGEIDLKAFLDYVSKATGNHFLYDDKTLAGKVILLAPTEIPEENLYSLLESLLEYEGFALEPTASGLIKLRRAGELLRKPIPLLMPDDLESLPESDKVVATAYQMKYISVTEVQTAVAPLISIPQGAAVIAPIQRANMLIVTDTVSNLKRIARIIRAMDDENNVPKLEIIQCQFAKAETLAGQIARVVRSQESGAARPAEQQTSFDYDPSSNSVIIVALEGTLAKVRALVAMLDVEPPASASTWRIYPLKNTKAEEVANTLQQLAEGAPTGVRSVPGAAQRAPGAGMSVAMSVGELKIIGDKNTNSIIVVGPIAAQKGIEGLITELDKRRPQVLIEALVVQVSGGSDLDIGTELANWNADDDPGISTATSFGFSEYNFATGARAIAEGEGMTNWLVRNSEIPILLRMLLVDNGGKIISRPRLLANDNYEAKFESLDESPYTSVNTMTTTTSSTSFSGYQKAGTELKITPHISEDQYLSLDIELNLSQFTGAGIAGSESTPGVPPPRRSDNLKTSVTVPNETTIVIGGLSGAHKTEMIRQVPILGKIPLLGLLFSRKVTNIDDTVEYIFIKARIASKEDFSDLRDMSEASRQDSERLQKAPAGVIPEESRESGGM